MAEEFPKWPKWHTQAAVKRAYVRVLEQLFQVNAGMISVTNDELKELLRKEHSGECQLYEDFEKIYREAHENWRAVKGVCPCCGGKPHPLPWEEKVVTPQVELPMMPKPERRAPRKDVTPRPVPKQMETLLL